jgi:HEPN domain-containing protein
MKDPKGGAERWLRQAEYDLQAAEHNADGEFHSIACFNAQQAAEKALKAFLFAQGERVVLGHSVGELCHRCGEYEEDFADLAASAGKLDRFYIPTRYPNALPGGVPAEVYDEEDATGAIALASKVLAMVRRVLPLDQEGSDG